MSDLDRDVLIDLCKDGTLTCRARGSRPFNGAALSVYSVDTFDDARALIVRVGKLQYESHPLLPDEPWYRLWWFDGNIESLGQVTDYLREQSQSR